MKFFATILCSLFVVSVCAETKPSMNKDTKLKRESASTYGGSGGYSSGGHGGGGGGSNGLSLSYGVPSLGGSSGGHQQIQLSPISLDMLSGGGGGGGGGHGLSLGGGGQGHYILDTSKLSALLGAQGLNLDTSKLLSSGGGHGLNLGSYGGGAQSANQLSAQALIGGGGDHGSGAQSGGTQYGFTLAPSSGGYGSGGGVGFSFGNADKQGPITFGQQSIQSPPAATYGIPTSSYQIPVGSYGAPISSFGQGHSFGGSFGSLGGLGNLGGGSSHSGGQDLVPTYAAGIKGLGHYTSSSPFNTLSSSHFAQLSLPGAKYGTPLFTSGKSYGGSPSGFNFAQPSVSSYRHTAAVPTYAGLTSSIKSTGSFRPSVFLGASSQDSGDLSSYTSGGSSASYTLPSKTYIPASTGSYYSGQTYSFPSSSSSSSHGSLGSLGSLGSSGGSYSFPSSSSHSSLGSLGVAPSYSSTSHGNLGSLGGGGSSYSFPSSSSSSSHAALGGGSSGDSYGSGSFDGHNNYNTIDYSSQH